MLKVNRLSAWYGPVQVLWDVSLSVDAGQALGVIGRNGAGKTTMLLSIARVHRTTQGTILLEDRDLSPLEPYQVAQGGVAFVRENAPVFPNSSISDHFMLGQMLAARRNLSPMTSEELFEIFPALQPLMHKKAGILSGGQRQLLALAVAMAGRPRLLLLDEPSTGLAPEAAATVFQALREFVRGGLSLLIAEQNRDWLEAVTEQVVVVEAGRTLEHGQLAAVR